MGNKMTQKTALKSQKTKSEEVEALRRLTVVLPTSLHRRLKVEAVKSDQTMAEIVKECIEHYLRNKEG